MKNWITVLVLSVLFVGCGEAIVAQAVKRPDQIQKWEPVIGKWKSEEEQRASPTATWATTSSEWEIQWVPGEFIVEIRGTQPIGGSFAEFHGYDPQLKTIVGIGFSSDGTVWRLSAEGWRESTLTDNWTEISPDGTSRIGRCTWEHAADFKTVTGSCDLFTDGQWWTCRKVKGTKVE